MKTSEELAQLTIYDCCVPDEDPVINYVCDAYLLKQRFEEFYKYREDMYLAGQENPNLSFKDFITKQTSEYVELIMSGEWKNFINEKEIRTGLETDKA